MAALPSGGTTAEGGGEGGKLVRELFSLRKVSLVVHATVHAAQRRWIWRLKVERQSEGAFQN